MSLKAVIVKKGNKYIYVNYFRRFKDDYDMLLQKSKYTFAEVDNLYNKEDTKNFGEFLRLKGVGDTFQF